MREREKCITEISLFSVSLTRFLSHSCTHSLSFFVPPCFSHLVLSTHQGRLYSRENLISYQINGYEVLIHSGGSGECICLSSSRSRGVLSQRCKNIQAVEMCLRLLREVNAEFCIFHNDVFTKVHLLC